MAAVVPRLACLVEAKQESSGQNRKFLFNSTAHDVTVRRKICKLKFDTNAPACSLVFACG